MDKDPPTNDWLAGRFEAIVLNLRAITSNNSFMPLG
jgi:hypothetical protein